MNQFHIDYYLACEIWFASKMEVMSLPALVPFRLPAEGICEKIDEDSHLQRQMPPSEDRIRPSPSPSRQNHCLPSRALVTKLGTQAIPRPASAGATMRTARAPDVDQHGRLLFAELKSPGQRIAKIGVDDAVMMRKSAGADGGHGLIDGAPTTTPFLQHTACVR